MLRDEGGLEIVFTLTLIQYMSGAYSGEVGAYQHQTLSLHRWARLRDETPSVYRHLHVLR